MEETQININSHPHIISEPGDSITPDPRGVGYVYYHSMMKYKERIAQIEVNSKQQENFGDLLKRCVRTAIAMQNMGIKPGDVISSCTFNDLDTCVPYVASLFTGAVMAAVDPTFSVREIIYLLNLVSAKIIFVSETALCLIEEVVRNLAFEITIVVYGETSPYTPFSDFLKVCPDEDKFKPREPENLNETAAIMFSSGTTGRPKGVCHTHLSMLSNVIIEKSHDGLTITSFSSIYWIVFHFYMHKSIINGLTRLIFGRFNYNNPWSILNYKIDYCFLCTMQCKSFLKHKKSEELDLANLKSLMIGGNYASVQYRSTLQSLFPNTKLCFSYGQTEVFNTVFWFPDTPHGRELAAKYKNSDGLPIKGFSYKIVDVQTEEILGSNQLGELRIKSNCVAKGYYNCDPSVAFDVDGWLKTGDLAYYNDEKCFFIKDRVKETFKYLGDHISPVEIENVLLTHPSVKNAVVLGLPHETDDCHPIAVVQLIEECEDVTTEEIIKYVEKRVEDKNQLRGGVRLLKNLPLTVTNKINRGKLRDMLRNHEV